MVPRKTEGSRAQDRDPPGEDGISTSYYPSLDRPDLVASNSGRALNQANSRGFWTLPALDHIDNDLLPFAERREPRSFEGGGVDE